MANIYALRRASKLPNNKFMARWRLAGGGEQEHALTEQEYRALAGKNAGPPPNRTGDALAVWLHAYEAWTFDTPTGNLEPGDITEAWSGVVTIRTGDGEPKIGVPIERITGSLTDLARFTIAKANLPEKVTVLNGICTVTD